MSQRIHIFVLAVSLAVSALAQSSAGLGSISGLVQDASGSVVPGATVVVANDSKGIRRNLVTTSQGQFTAPALLPSAGYKVTVSKSGFANYEANNITLAVGQNVDLHVGLEVATTVTTVDVSTAAIAVEDTKTDVSQLVGQRQILDLPINGRRVDQFVLMSPAVAPDGAFGLLSFRGIAGHNSFLTDGNDTTNTYFNENAGRTRISSPIDGRGGEHDHQERLERSSRHRLLVLPESHTERQGPVCHLQSAGQAESGWCRHWRRDRQGQIVLLLQL